MITAPNETYLLFRSEPDDVADNGAGATPNLRQSESRSTSLLPIILFALLAVLFFIHVKKYYFLGDDSFISFRYARNLVEGHGLVYNPGERVEGYTNFLWVLMMTGIMQLGLPVEIMSNVIGILSGGAILFLLVRLGAQRSSWHHPGIWIAPFALSVNRTFCGWSSGGLGTQFFSLLVLAAFLRFEAERRSKDKRSWISALIFVLAALMRPEGLMFFGVAALFFLTDRVVLRKRTLRSLLIWATVFIIPIGAHFAWRYSYYGYWLPNTFYAKVSGLWIDQGAHFLGLFLADHQLIWFAPLLPLLFILQRDRFSLLCLVILCVYTAYMFYVGGDSFEFRLLTVVLPYLFWLLQEAVIVTVERWRHHEGLGVPVIMSGCGVGLLIVWAGYRPNTLRYEKVRYGNVRIETIRNFALMEAQEGRFLRRLVDKGFLRGDELLAVSGAGALPYYSRMPVIDCFGLNDVSIAHQQVVRRGTIGHEKHASFEYLKQRGVVIYDVRNHLLHHTRAPQPFPRFVKSHHYSGPLHCVEAEGRYMIFATTLDDDHFREVFSRFRILY